MSRDQTPEADHPGRLRGGLRHVRGAVLVELIKSAARALKEHRGRLGWSAASGLLGSGIGLLVAMLWAHTVGWR
jgi:hypothetical protein